MSEPDYTRSPGGFFGGNLKDLDTTLRYWPKGSKPREVEISIRQYAQSLRHHLIVDIEAEYNYIWDSRLKDYGDRKTRGWVRPWDYAEDREGRPEIFHGYYPYYHDAIVAMQKYVEDLPPAPPGGYVFKVNGYGWGPDLDQAIREATMTVRQWGGYIKEGD